MVAAAPARRTCRSPSRLSAEKRISTSLGRLRIGDFWGVNWRNLSWVSSVRRSSRKDHARCAVVVYCRVSADPTAS